MQNNVTTKTKAALHLMLGTSSASLSGVMVDQFVDKFAFEASDIIAGLQKRDADSQEPDASKTIGMAREVYDLVGIAAHDEGWRMNGAFVLLFTACVIGVVTGPMLDTAENAERTRLLQEAEAGGAQSQTEAPAAETPAPAPGAETPPAAEPPAAETPPPAADAETAPAAEPPAAEGGAQATQEQQTNPQSASEQASPEA